jgi:hypothetical protein
LIRFSIGGSWLRFCGRGLQLTGLRRRTVGKLAWHNLAD